MNEASLELIKYLQKEICLLREKNQIMRSCLESISKLDFRYKKSPESLLAAGAISRLGDVNNDAKKGKRIQTRGISGSGEEV